MGGSDSMVQQPTKNEMSLGCFAGGKVWSVNSLGKGDFATIQAAVNAASEGDVIEIDATAEYDANTTVTKSKLTFKGVGAGRAVRVTSVGTNSTAFILDGADDVQFENMNISGRGTGDAVELTGQVRRVTFVDCRLAGASAGNGVQIAASAGGQVADVVFERCRIEGQDGVEFSTGEGGDPASQIYFKECDFQYCSALAINHPTNSFSTGLFVLDCKFLPEEDGTEPSAGWIKADNAAQTGMISDCSFGSAALTTSNIAIDAGVMWVANKCETGVSTARPQAPG